MPLRRNTYTAYLTDGREVVVDVLHQDQLRAETALAAAGIDYRTHPLHMTDAWVWAALLRMEVIEKGTRLRDFQMTILAGLEEAGSEELDPTQSEATNGGASDYLPQTPSPGSTGGPAPTTD